jgi:negative regulator of flagellin synthesis FlgM
MADPVSINARIANQAASRTTLEKLDNKAKAAKSASSSEAKAAPAPTPQNADSVNLSNVAQRVKDTPDFDRAKVEAIKTALREGSYPINPRRIAENFVALEKMI